MSKNRNQGGDSYELAEKAISAMRERNIRPLPENYVVWYGYYSEANPDLKRTIDILKSNNRTIDEEIIRQLYKKYYTFEFEGEQFLQTAEKTDNVIIDLKKYLSEYSEKTNKYGTQLRGVSEAMEGGHKPDAFRDLVHALIQSTDTIQEENKVLQEKLENSQKEVVNLKLSMDNLKIEASTDNLTGIANRKLFEATLLRDMAESVEEGKPLSLLMIDIDHFKKFNDTHGHLVGDQVIRLVAQTLVKHTPSKGLSARYGGEEFSIVLPEKSAKEALQIANDIRLSMASKLIQNKKTGASLGKVTISIGATHFRFGESIVDFIDRADEALYSAKNAGRNRVVLI